MKSNEERLHSIFEKAAEKKRKRKMYLRTGAAAVVCLLCTVSAVGVAVNRGDSGVGIGIQISMDYSSATGGTKNIGKFSTPVTTHPDETNAPTVTATGHGVQSQPTDTVTQPKATSPTQPATTHLPPPTVSAQPTVPPTAEPTEKPVYERPIPIFPTVPTTQNPMSPVAPGCPAPTQPDEPDSSFVPVTEPPLGGENVSPPGNSSGSAFENPDVSETLLPAKAFMVVSTEYFSMVAEELQYYDPDTQLNGLLGDVWSDVKFVFADTLFKQMNGSADDVFLVKAYIVCKDHAEAARLLGLEADSECEILYRGECSLRQLADAMQAENCPQNMIIWLAADAQNAE